MNKAPEAVDGEVVDESRAVVVAAPRELINVDQAIAEWDAYQELTRRLLTDDDYQRIGDKKFKKKSAWRKYAKAFNISCEEISKEIVRAEDGYPIYARVVVRATEPSGRWQDADQECHVTEKCCVAATSRMCSKRHTHCLPACDGRHHFSHPGDIPAVATTRAKNRAISDLIGAGEVSFEEAETDPGERKARRPAATKTAEPPPAEQSPIDPGPDTPFLSPAGDLDTNELGAYMTQQGITAEEIGEAIGLPDGKKAGGPSLLKWRLAEPDRTITSLFEKIIAERSSPQTDQPQGEQADSEERQRALLNN